MIDLIVAVVYLGVVFGAALSITILIVIVTCASVLVLSTLTRSRRRRVDPPDVVPRQAPARDERPRQVLPGDPHRRAHELGGALALMRRVADSAQTVKFFVRHRCRGLSDVADGRVLRDVTLPRGDDAVPALRVQGFGVLELPYVTRFAPPLTCAVNLSQNFSAARPWLGAADAVSPEHGRADRHDAARLVRHRATHRS